MKKKVLWISMRAPYDKVKHAGGKTHNHYLKSLANDSEYAITLITWGTELEKQTVISECSECGIEVLYNTNYTKGYRKFFRKTINIETFRNPYNRFAGFAPNSMVVELRKSIRQLVKNNYTPDVVIMQWTQVNLLVKEVKKAFPKARIIEIEEDVAYQGYERKVRRSETETQRKRLSSQAEKLKRLEIEALMCSDLVVVNNEKDRALLISEGMLTPILKWSPYFQKLEYVSRGIKPRKNILFYGAMYREENWKSAIWFIDKVMPLLNSVDVELHVIGANPPDVLKCKETNNIRIWGYVDDLEKCFEDSMCLVAPLVLGAGIKVKILEALSAGIPVLTNEVGIEGIGARNGVEYYHCETPEQYVAVIEKMLVEPEGNYKMGMNERLFIQKHFNYEIDAHNFRDAIEAMALE